jgi:ribosomal protein S18 acetylase RimI-like enzyme
VTSATRVRVRRIGAEEWELWRSLRLAALADAPYAFSTRLADVLAHRDRETDWRSRLESAALTLVGLLDEEPAGMVAVDIAGEEAHLVSMWAAPFARGTGLADALVGSVLEWAREACQPRVRLWVRAANERAIALYRRHGFEESAEADLGGECDLVLEWRLGVC